MSKATQESRDLELVEKLRSSRALILEQMQKIIVGQEQVIEEILITLFSRGHGLLLGVPGLAKTLMVSSLSRILDLQFKRIQFTPDLMPSDITGSEILQEDPRTHERIFRFIQGPVFSNILLADEINRTPPKTQSALLQAMQEYQVSVAGVTHPLPLPFFVLATQNPIEQEGTYPLPEAQLDRFLLQINLDYPSLDEEKKIVVSTTGGLDVGLKQVLNAEDVIELQQIVRRVPVADSVVHTAVELVRSTRAKSNHAPDFIQKWVSWGAGPRASQSLILAGKARAILSGRYAVSQDDVLAVSKPVLRHRILLNFQAEAEGIKTDQVIEKLQAAV
ncbi:MAG: MoxR family ATPase [Elusimicrobia bacterium]|nr:MoxR family ATPase [Elusimicrobiota bacterium]